MERGFKRLSPEELAALPVYREEEEEGSDETDSGTYSGKGYIYIAFASGTNDFKIGRTGNILRRKQQLQTGNPNELEMYAVEVSSMTGAEGKLKKEMKSSFEKPDGGSEWFSGNVDKAIDIFEKTATPYYVAGSEIFPVS